jgi:hypothetical protein
MADVSHALIALNMADMALAIHCHDGVPKATPPFTLGFST